MDNKALNQSNSTKSTQQSDVIDLGKLLGLLIDSRWLIISVTTLFAIAGIGYALLATPIYKADALLQVEEKSSGMSSLVGDMGDMFSTESSATTEIEIIKSRMILGATVDKFNLTTQISANYTPFIGKGLARLQGEQHIVELGRFDFPAHSDDSAFTLVVDDKQTARYSLYDNLGNKILSGSAGELTAKNDYRLFVKSIDAPTGAEFTLSKRSRLAAIQWLQGSLSVSERGKSSGILSLSFSGENKQQIEELLNDISQNYFLQNVQRNSAEAEKSLQFLQNNLPSIKQKLTAAEDVLNNFRQANDSIDLGLEAQSTLQSMVALEAQLNELTFKESEISQLFTKDHPSYKSLLDKRQVLLAEKERLDDKVQALPKTQREVLRMTRDVEVNQQIYIQLLNKVQELSVLKAGTVGNVRILDKAQAYSNPIKPKKPLIVVLATLLGGMLAVAFVLLREAFHKGVETPEEIEALGLPVYASVPKSEWQVGLENKLKKKQRTKEFNLREVILSEANPADLAIESLRALRTSMHFAMLEAKNNVVMISGSAPSVGKTFVSVNFAAVLAKSDQRVLLIDADLRKGYLQRYFGLQGKKGVTELISEQLQAKDVINHSGIDNLDVVIRGQVPPNPSELLMHPHFADFIKWASSEYDFIIIDTPPVLAVTDPSIIGSLAGTTLMVARFDESTAKEIEVAKQRFEMAGIEVKGVILNAVEKKAGNAYGYGYGYYHYSYK